MPLKQCKIGSKNGWKWGDSGKCYASKKDAIKQGIAIDGPKKFKQEASRSDLQFDSDVQLAIAHYKEPRSNPANKYIEAIAEEMERGYGYISQKERDKVPAEDFGEKESRKYPVRNQKDLESAWKLSGKSKTASGDSIRKKLTEIAKRKGLKLPSSVEEKDKSKSVKADSPSPGKIKIKVPVRKVGPKPAASPLTRAQKMPAKYLLKKALSPGGA